MSSIPIKRESESGPLTLVMASGFRVVEAAGPDSRSISHARDVAVLGLDPARLATHVIETHDGKTYVVAYNSTLSWVPQPRG